MLPKKLITLSLCLLAMTGCTQQQLFDNRFVEPATVTDRTKAGEILAALPVPAQKVPVVVYDFQDQTGQFKFNGLFTDYSSAVTKGGNAILVKALLDSGNRQWFTVAERAGLKNLLQERQLINVMRKEYKAADGKKLPSLPPLLYGGVMLEGGIISYDSNTVTGGLGATYLGIGLTTQYHRDVVTVYIRAVSVQTGEVLLAVTSSKTIYSTSLDANLLKYITFDRLLQSEAGFTANEPTQLGVRQAIETAVYSLIMEGAMDKLWTFKDVKAGNQAIHDYLERRDGKAPPLPTEKPVAAATQAAPVQTVSAQNVSKNSTNLFQSSMPSPSNRQQTWPAARNTPVAVN